MRCSEHMAPHVVLLFLVCSSFCTEGAPNIQVIGDKTSASDPADLSAPPGQDPMQQLLNWGIEHSDPERLKEIMQKYKDQNLTIKDVYGQDVLDALFVDEGSVMKDMTQQIADYANKSVADEDLEMYLERLMELVEQVDNAGNLHRMGGLRPLLELGVSGPLVGPQQVRRSEAVRSLALWTLGVATQNNAPVQEDLMDIGALPLLLGRLPLCDPTTREEAAGSEYCTKLIFVLSGLVRNNQTYQAAADSQGLFEWLLDTGIRHPTSSIAKKSMGLLDIVFSQTPDLEVINTLPAKQNVLATSLLAQIHSEQSSHDADAAEKALRLVNRLLSLRPMLFESSFRSDFTKAVAAATRSCEQTREVGDEVCTGLMGLAEHASMTLTARDLPDDEL